MPKIVLVTGANKGIGLEVARQLGRRGHAVILGARDAARGDAAATALVGEGIDASAVVLDVADGASIAAAAEAIKGRHGRLDVLVNNAGIYLDKEATIGEVTRAMVMETFQTNTFGPIEVAQAMLPLLRAAGSARIVNVSSGYGQLGGLSNEAPSYCLSKLALNGATILLAAALKEDGIAVNSACPGWVRTDMGGPNAKRSVEQGADGIAWLADEAPAQLSGKFFRDRKEIPW